MSYSRGKLSAILVHSEGIHMFVLEIIGFELNRLIPEAEWISSLRLGFYKIS